MAGTSGGDQPRFLPLMCIASHLASVGVAQLARVLRRSGPSPGLLPNAGSTLLSLCLGYCYLPKLGGGGGAIVVPTCRVTGDGLEHPGEGSWHSLAELVVVLSLVAVH